LEAFQDHCAIIAAPFHRSPPSTNLVGESVAEIRQDFNWVGAAAGGIPYAAQKRLQGLS